MFYKTAKLRNMLSRLEKRAFTGKAIGAGVNLAKLLLGSKAQTGIKAIPKTLGSAAPKIEGALGKELINRKDMLSHAYSDPMKRITPTVSPLNNSQSLPQNLEFEDMLRQGYRNPMQRITPTVSPLNNSQSFPWMDDFSKFSHDQRFREKRAIAALLGPLFKAVSRAPLTTAAVGLGGMAGYEFARQPKKLANPALLPNASTAPPPNNDAGLQKTSLDRQILGALLRR